jgi:hypothetical protein
MRKVFLGAVAILALLASGFAAGVADDAVSIAYESGDLIIAAPAGTEYQVWAEQPDGLYDVVGAGALDASGLLVGALDVVGPIDDSPQFVVAVGGDGGGYFAISDPGNQWWID